MNRVIINTGIMMAGITGGALLLRVLSHYLVSMATDKPFILSSAIVIEYDWFTIAVTMIVMTLGVFYLNYYVKDWGNK